MDTATEAAIKAALLKLDHANDEHWTSGGKPAMKALEAILGDTAVTRAQVEQVAPDFARVVDKGDPPSPSEAKGNERAFVAIAAFDGVMGNGDGFTGADLDLAANAKDASDFWREWLKAHDPDKLHKRPYHMLSQVQQARIAVFVAVAKAS